MQQRQLNSVNYPITFLLIDSGNHIGGLSDAQPTVYLGKNGGPFVPASGAVLEMGFGWYCLLGHPDDRNTLGELSIHVNAAGADPYDEKYEVVPWDPFDASLGLEGLKLEGGEYVKIADTTLGRDLGQVLNPAQRSPLQALRALRNRASTAEGELRVYQEDDQTVAWRADVGTAPAIDPIVSIDPK